MAQTPKPVVPKPPVVKPDLDPKQVYKVADVVNKPGYYSAVPSGFHIERAEPGGRHEGDSFFSNPQRVARYYLASQALPQGVQPKVDTGALGIAYNYLKARNDGKPFYLWQTDALDDEEYRSFVGGIQTPPVEAMLPEEAAFWGPRMAGQAQAQPGEYQPGEVTNNVMGMPQEQWDALPDWQKWVIPLLPAFGKVAGAVGGGAAGFGIAGPGGAAAGAAAGYGGMALAEKNPGIANLLMKLDIPAEWLERSAGVLGQVSASLQNPDEYGPVIEILNNLPAAWQAAQLTYDVSLAEIAEPGVQGWNGVWQAPAGQDPADYALYNARKEIQVALAQGATAEDITAIADKYKEMFGLSGQLRDMAGHMILDPLNLIGVGIVQATGDIAKMAGNASLARAASMGGESTLKMVQEYGRIIRQLPKEEAARFGGLSKFIAGLDEAGNLRDFKPGIDHMLGLTPASRAAESLNYTIDGMSTFLNDYAKTDPHLAAKLVRSVAMAKPEDAVKALDGSPLPRWFDSAEAQHIPVALRDALPKVDEMVNMWDATRANASILQRVADATGTDVMKLLDELHNATPQEAQAIYRTFINKLGAQAQTDKNAARLFQTIGADTTASKLDGIALKKMADTFTGDDSVPFLPSQFNANLMVALAESADNWAAKYFNVKPANWAVRLGTVIKRAQSYALLGLNPSYFMNNALNNIVTMSYDGLLKLNSRRAMRKFMDDMGLSNISRLRSGNSAADIGAMEATLATRQKGKGFEIGGAIRKAGRAESGGIQAADDLLRENKLLNKLGIFTAASQKFEQLSSEIAMVTGIREFWNKTWTAGSGFDKVPTELAQVLNQYQPGLARKVEQAVARGKSQAQIQAEVFGDLQRKSLADVLTPDERASFDARFPDLFDQIDEGLSKANTPEKVRTVFTDARRKIQENIANQIQQAQADLTRHAVEKAQVEGQPGALDLADDLIESKVRFDLDHFERMDRVADEASKNRKLRKVIWENALREEDNNYSQFNSVFAAKWLGLVDGLGGDDAARSYMTARLWEVRDNYAAFYARRRDLMNEFYEFAYNELDDRAVSQKWAEVQTKLNDEYADMVIEEARVQDLMDEHLAQVYGVRHGMEAEAKKWRSEINKVRRQQVAAMALYRNGTMPKALQAAWGDVLPKETVAAIRKLNGGKPAWQMGVQDRDAAAKKFYSDIYTPLVRETLEASNANAPVKGAPKARKQKVEEPEAEAPKAAEKVEEPTAKVEEPEPVADVPAEVAPEPVVAAPEAPRPAPLEVPEMVTPSMEQRRTDIRIRSHGYDPKVTADKHILNIIKKYTNDAPETLDDVTDEMLERAFANRQNAKAGQADAARVEEVADALDRGAEPPKVYPNQTRAMFADELYNTLPDKQQAGDTLKVFDAFADHYAQVNGTTPDEWWKTHFLERGTGEMGEDALAQGVDNRRLTPTELRDYARSLVRAGEDEVRRAVSYEDSPADKVRLLDEVHKVNPAVAEKIASKLRGELFQDAAGYTRWLDDGRAVMTMLEQSNVSTVIHEGVHVYTPQMPDSEAAVVSKWLRDEYKMDLPDGWHKTRGGEYRDAKETLARGFERYLAEGKAPTPALKQVFDNFRAWMLHIYKRIRGSDIDVRLNDDVRALFDEWMGKKPEAEAPRPVDAMPTKPEGEGPYAGWATEQELAWRGPKKPKPFTDVIDVNPDDIDYNFAVRAYSGVSMSPEARAARVQYDYVQHMRALIDELKPLADTPEKQATLAEHLERYKKGYIEHYNSYLGAKSRVVSTMIAGPANFPARSMNKRADTESRRLGEFIEWSKKAQQAINRDLNPLAPRAIASGDPEAIAKKQTKIDALEKYHQMMLDANKVIRKKNLTDEQKVQELVAIGIDETQAHKLMTPDFAGRQGYASFHTQNNNAEIHRLKERIVEIERLQAAPAGEFTFDGGRIVENKDADRVQIFFDGKPDEATRENLKRNGFKWAPSQGAWQRQLTENARSAVKRVFPDAKAAEVVDEAIETADNFIEPKINDEEPNAAPPKPERDYDIYGRRLFQTAPRDPAPVGTVDHLSEPPIEMASLEGYMRDVAPMFDRAETALSGADAMTYRIDGLPAQAQKALRAYLGKVYSQLTDTKMGAIRWGEMRRDGALLNYTRRYGFDNVLGTVMPYEFWTTRSMMRWALRALDKPAILANYARLRTMGNQYIDSEGFPNRLRKKMGIRLPFLPEWMGEGIYLDPLRQIFPFEAMTRPWDKLQEQQNMAEKRAVSILQQMVADESADADQVADAVAAQAGPLWDRAIAQAQNELDQDIQSPLDFASMMSGFSLPVQWAHKALTGRTEDIGQLPVTRGIQAVTGALGIGGPRGINIEGPIRKGLGLPEVDKYEDYRVDRMLANLAATGDITADDAQRAMMDREGPVFEEAQRRVSQLGMAQYIGAPLSVDFFPEGEQLQRGLANEYDTAITAWKNGDTEALTAFFDKYPEYQARMASFQEPTERMRRFLISEVWQAYNDLPALYKRQVREQMGDTFTDAFLNKETRSYDSIKTDTLAQWAQTMNNNIDLPKTAPQVDGLPLKFADPQAALSVEQFYAQRDQKYPGVTDLNNLLYSLPEGAAQDQFRAAYPQTSEYSTFRNRYLADNPVAIPHLVGQDSEMYGYPVEVQQAVYQFKALRDENWPDLFEMQDEYFALDKAGRRGYLAQHPELKNYWDWRKQYAAQYPQAATFILGDEKVAELIDPNAATYAAAAQRFSPQLTRQFMGALYAGEGLSAGAQQELRRIWREVGAPGNFDEWLEGLKEMYS